LHQIEAQFNIRAITRSSGDYNSSISYVTLISGNRHCKSAIISNMGCI
jgi:hypothetical protein